jgi:hypothetical protein
MDRRVMRKTTAIYFIPRAFGFAPVHVSNYQQGITPPLYSFCGKSPGGVHFESTSMILASNMSLAITLYFASVLPEIAPLSSPSIYGRHLRRERRTGQAEVVSIGILSDEPLF